MGTRSNGKRIASFVACAAILALLIPAIALAQDAGAANGSTDEFEFAPGQALQAQDDSTSGTWGGCVWWIDGDTLTVTPGEDSNAAGAASQAPWGSYQSQAQNCSFIVFKEKDGVKVKAPSNCTYLFYLSKVRSVDFSGFDTSSVTSTEYMFKDCRQLSSIDTTMLDTSNVISFREMFSGCESLGRVKASGLITEKANDVSSMFEFCEQITQIDLTGINTSNVKTFEDMFGRCEKVGSIDLSSFNTSSAENLEGMFYDCRELKSIDVSGFNTSNVKTFEDMFDGCIKLTILDVSGFDTKNATSFENMFASCLSLTELDVSKFETSNCSNMRYMFLNCSSLKSIDVSSFDTQKVGSFERMFAGCSSLKEIDLSEFNTSAADNMDNMFRSCGSLERVNVSSFDTSGVTNFRGMFVGCTSLREIDISNFDTSHQNYFSFLNPMFQYCTALERVTVGSGASGEYFERLFLLPSVAVEGHAAWYSTRDGSWLTSYEIAQGRPGVADTYQKWSDDIADAKATIADQRYTGSPVEPGAVVVMGEHALVEGVDYEIAGYSDNVEPGDAATVTLRGIGRYKGEADFRFAISDAEPTWTRLAGANRYATMALAVQQAFPEESKWAVVVSGEDENFADALSAAALAGARNCPIVTTKPDELASEARSELERLGACHIVIVGGYNAVSEDVEGALKDLVAESEGSVERIAGDTRYETSLLVMEASARVRAPRTVLVATGGNFADALAAGPWSYRNGAPILLVDPETGPAEEQIAAIKASGAGSVVILGGPKAVPASAEAALEEAGLDVERIAGTNRYKTAAAIARWSMQKGARLGANAPLVATGKKSADALVGSALAGARNSIIVFADEADDEGRACYSDAVKLLGENKGQLLGGYFLGGKNAVTPTVASAVVKNTDAKYQELRTA